MNDEEVLKDKERRRKKAAHAYFKSSIEFKKERKRKIIKVLSAIVLIFIIVKITIGEIVIPFPIKYRQSRLYEVYLNDLDMTVELFDKKKTTIIPYFLYIVQDRHTSYYGTGEVYSTLKESDTYKLKINSYKCYSKVPSLIRDKIINYQLSCDTEDEYIKELTNDTKYKLYISRTYKGKITILYDDIFIEDITPYIKEKGRYSIQITGNYKNVESVISFSVDKKK